MTAPLTPEQEIEARGYHNICDMTQTRIATGGACGMCAECLLAAALATIDALRDDIDAARADAGRLVGFARSVLRTENGDLSDIQEIALKYELVMEVEATEPCAGPDGCCPCAEFGFPATCYRFTTILSKHAARTEEPHGNG